MREATWTNIRAHLPRLVAVTLAVAIAVAFMSATLILNSSMRATLRASIGADYAAADLIVQRDSQSGSAVVPDRFGEEIAGLDGVAAVYAPAEVYFSWRTASQSQSYVSMSGLAPESLRTTVLESGRLPDKAGELAVDSETAKQFGLEVGDQIEASVIDVTDGSSGAPVATEIVGVVAPPKNPLLSGSNTYLGAYDAVRELALEQQSSLDATSVQVKVAAGADVEAVRDEIAAVAAGNQAYQGIEVQTRDERVTADVAQFTGGADILTIVMMAFVVVALFVCGLVISNTFAVLIAQRTRELALLRCIGADRRQISRSVLGEAAAMGAVASVIGAIAAIGLMSLLISLAPLAGLDATLGVLSVGWPAIVFPILVGVALTVVSALAPARAATRVAPLQALRPIDDPSVSTTAGRGRLIAGIVLVVIGVALLAMGAALPLLVSSVLTVLPSLALALFGALVSATGILLLAVFVMPAVTGWVGRLLGRTGVPARLAALNSVRNPRRTAATASALLIGVTLVSTFYTGAAVARATFSQQLDLNYPVDIVVTQQAFDSSGDTVSSGDGSIDANLIGAMDGVAVAVSAREGYPTEGDLSGYQVIGVDPSDYARVSRVDAALADGHVLVEGNEPGTSVTIGGDGGTVSLSTISVGSVGPATAVVTTADFDRIFADQKSNTVLVKTVDGLTAGDLTSLRDDISAALPGAYVSGSVLARTAFNQVIDILLLIVTGLLAVAIVIALIGVSNTLSLSVIERTRESALLRALGLTRGQLRGMLAIEALLLAAVAAVLGVVLGVGYGYLGAASVLGVFGSLPPFAVPWLPLAVIVAVAAAAGLMASIAPARRAAKLSPVAGLATT